MTNIEDEESEKPQPPDNGRELAKGVLPVNPSEGPAGTPVTIRFDKEKFKKIKDEKFIEEQFNDKKINEDLAVIEGVWFGKKEARGFPAKSPTRFTVIAPEKAKGGPDKVKIWIQLDYDFIYVGDFTYEEKKVEALKPEAEIDEIQKAKAQAEAQKEKAQKEKEKAQEELAQAEAQITEARVAEARKVLEQEEAHKARVAEAQKLVQKVDGKPKKEGD